MANNYEEDTTTEEEEPCEAPPAPKAFRTNSMQLFITFPMCAIPKEGMLDHLTDLCFQSGWIILEYLIAEEEHESGEPHLHVYLKFSSKINLKDSTIFDFGKPGEEHYYHPNIQGCRSPSKVISYITKGDNWISNFHQCDVWSRILKPDVTVPDAVALVVAEKPREWCLNGDRIERNLRRVKPKREFVPKYATESFSNVPGAARDWVRDVLMTPTEERSKCLILIGPSMMGKTQWARSLVQPHMFFRSGVNLSSWQDSAQLLIIDDIPWKFLPYKKALLTKMGEQTVTGKYKPQTDINVTMPAIVLMNEEDAGTHGEDDVPLSSDPYWEVNAVIVRITEPLF